MFPTNAFLAFIFANLDDYGLKQMKQQDFSEKNYYYIGWVKNIYTNMLCCDQGMACTNMGKTS